MPGSVLKDKIGNLEARKAELVELMAGSAEPTPLLHPNMAEIYRRRILELHERLYDDEGKAEAVEVLRTLIDEVTLIPEGSDLTIVLRGDLAAMLTFASNKEKAQSPFVGRAFGRSLIAGIDGCGRAIQPKPTSNILTYMIEVPYF